jgi:hypothetical protein
MMTLALPLVVMLAVPAAGQEEGLLQEVAFYRYGQSRGPLARRSAPVRA